MNQSELLDAREAARKKVVIDLQEGKEPEEGDTMSAMLKWLASEAAGKGFDEGVRFMESSQNVKGHATPEHAPKIDQTASSASHVPACSGSSLSDGGGDQDLETPYGKLSGRPMIQEVVGTIEANRLLESGAWSVSHVFNRGEDLVYVLGRRAKYPDPETASQGLRTFYERKKRDLDQAMVRPSESPHQAQPSHP